MLWFMSGRFMLWFKNMATNKVHKETKLKRDAHGGEHGLTGKSARVQCQWLKRVGAEMVAARNDRTEVP